MSVEARTRKGFGPPSAEIPVLTKAKEKEEEGTQGSSSTKWSLFNNLKKPIRTFWSSHGCYYRFGCLLVCHHHHHRSPGAAHTEKVGSPIGKPTLVHHLNSRYKRYNVSGGEVSLRLKNLGRNDSNGRRCENAYTGGIFAVFLRTVSFFCLLQLHSSLPGIIRSRKFPLRKRTLSRT